MSEYKFKNTNLNNSPIIVGNGNTFIQKLDSKNNNCELNSIIKKITDNLSGLDKEEAEQIIDIIDMAENELQKPEPKVSRLGNCLSLIASMITTVNGIPVLASNLQRLADYILLYLK